MHRHWGDIVVMSSEKIDPSFQEGLYVSKFYFTSQFQNSDSFEIWTSCLNVVSERYFGITFRLPGPNRVQQTEKLFFED